MYIWGLPFYIVLRVHFGKAEAACRRPQSSKPWPRLILESYILPNICPCYFSFNELYRECNGTTRAYVNSGYQALFSAITERLGTRLDFVSKFNLQQNGHHWNAPFVLITTVQIPASYLIPSPRYPSLVPRPFWEGETAWQLPRVQTVYGRNVTANAYLIQAVKST